MTDAEAIRDVITGHRYFWQNEYELQAAIEQVLTAADMSVERERVVGEAGRLDLYVGRTAVEVKVKGSVADVTRQLGQYARIDDVDSIVLVTSVARHRSVPREIFGTPVLVVPLLGGL